MDVRWIAIGVGIVGAGIGVIVKVFDMSSLTKRVMGGLGILLVVLGIGVVLWGFGVRFRSPFFIEEVQDGPIVSSKELPRTRDERRVNLASGCLTGEEEVNLMKALSVSASHSVYIQYVSGDLHSVTCAESFRRVVKGAGWEVRSFLPEDFGSSERGLSVLVKDTDALPLGAEIFVRVLTQHGIDVAVRPSPLSTSEYDIFALNSGYKP